jgi:transcriptional regulator with XRE-family HTH domain
MLPYEVLRQAIAAEVRAEVARQGKSLNEIAEVLGVDKGSASRRMWGQRSFRAEELSMVADLLGVSVAQFVPKVHAEVAS